MLAAVYSSMSCCIVSSSSRENSPCFRHIAIIFGHNFLNSFELSGIRLDAGDTAIRQCFTRIRCVGWRLFVDFCINPGKHVTHDYLIFGAQLVEHPFLESP